MPRKPRERPKGIFLGWEMKSNPGVLYPLGQIPQCEIDGLARTIVSVLRERNVDSEPDESGQLKIGQRITRQGGTQCNRTRLSPVSAHRGKPRRGQASEWVVHHWQRSLIILNSFVVNEDG